MAPSIGIIKPLQYRRLIRKPSRHLEKETKNPIREEPVMETVAEKVPETNKEPVIRTLRPRKAKEPTIAKPRAPKPKEPKKREIALNNIMTTAPQPSKEALELLQDLYYEKC